jgi:hypothetical protein
VLVIVVVAVGGCVMLVGTSSMGKMKDGMGEL